MLEKHPVNFKDPRRILWHGGRNLAGAAQSGMETGYFLRRFRKLVTSGLRVPQVPVGESTLPALAFGVGSAWLGDKEQQQNLKRTVLQALDTGFRHLDLAEAYHNSHVVGEAVQEWLQKTGCRREELFITNKVISLDSDIAQVCDQLLKDCRVDYFDLFLVHCAVSEENEPFAKPFPTMWEEMMSLQAAGKVKAIGVSNWRIEELQSIEGAAVQPVCNQLEAHPLLQQRGLRAYCETKRIDITCYGALAPLSRSGALDAAPLLRQTLEQLAERHQKTLGQVLLRWGHQTSRVLVTTTSNPQRMEEYLDMFSFELSEQDVQMISSAGFRSTQKRFTWPKCVGVGKFWSDDPMTEVESQEWPPSAKGAH